MKVFGYSSKAGKEREARQIVVAGDRKEELRRSGSGSEGSDEKREGEKDIVPALPVVGAEEREFVEEEKRD